MPWFVAQQPSIDWRNGKLLGMAGLRPEGSVEWICPGPVDTHERSTECVEYSSESCSLGCLQHSTAWPGARKFGVSLKVLPANDFAQLAERMSTSAATAGEGSRPWIHCIGLRQDLLGARSEGNPSLDCRRSEWLAERTESNWQHGQRGGVVLANHDSPPCCAVEPMKGSKETLVLVYLPSGACASLLWRDRIYPYTHIYTDIHISTYIYIYIYIYAIEHAN